jgi:zinc-binding alcohol dehydrogenase family protein
MRAIGARKFLPTSDPACLVEFEAQDPTPGPGDLIVRIHACAVNPVDTKVRKSLGETIQEAPRILGWDSAGTVIEIGSDVRDFKIGDEIFYSGDLTRPGCNAELQAVDARLVAHKPRNWSFEEAAALPLAGITAWELLFERMGVSPDGKDRGKAILIINGAGGVGSALIPLARDAGLTVIATASRPETIAWCQQLGAHHVINHREDMIAQSEALGFASYPFIANLHQPEIHWSEPHNSSHHSARSDSSSNPARHSTSAIRSKRSACASHGNSWPRAQNFNRPTCTNKVASSRKLPHAARLGNFQKSTPACLIP